MSLSRRAVDDRAITKFVVHANGAPSEDHDRAVAGGALEEKRLNKASSQVLASLIERRRFQLQRAAFDLGNRLFVEKPKAFAQRIEGYWETWRAEVRN